MDFLRYFRLLVGFSAGFGVWIGTASATESSHFRLNDRGGSMEGISRRNQEMTGLCYDEASITAFDAFRKSRGERIDSSTLSSAAIAGLDFKRKLNVDLLDTEGASGGWIRDMMAMLYEKGTCSRGFALLHLGGYRGSEEKAFQVVEDFVKEISDSRSSYHTDAGRVVPVLPSEPPHFTNSMDNFQGLYASAEVQAFIAERDIARAKSFEPLAKKYSNKLFSDFERAGIRFDANWQKETTSKVESILTGNLAFPDRVKLRGLFQVFFPGCAKSLRARPAFMTRNWAQNRASATFESWMNFAFMKKEKSQPVVLAFDVSVVSQGRSFQSAYPVYGNHAVLVIGRREVKGKPQYLIRDSRRPGVITDPAAHSRDWESDSIDALDYWIDGHTLEMATDHMLQMDVSKAGYFMESY
ncbi:MAG: hypothetical protein EBX52_03940 [Proteobacteria bacterium]|nr:hypothetical protein [Pseudomonadota bacterium]